MNSASAEKGRAPAIDVQGAVKRWGDTVAVNNVSFSVKPGTFNVVLGPSGCGKSTMLRMIAGLEELSDGRLLINGEDMTHTPPAARKLSMVFQSYALFPHLSVAENIVFGLKVRRVPASERDQRLARVAQLVGLSQLLDRKPAQLSGGQRQRVALARAVVAENAICLMDEPLSNLDAKLRQEMRIELRALQQRLGMTVVYVTHDQAEAMSMADKVILLRDGQIEQEGTPEALYNAPATAFTASFIGTPPMSILDTEPSGKGAVISGGGNAHVLSGTSSPLSIGIRPEKICIGNDNGIPAELVSADYLGADTIITAEIGAQKVLVRTPQRIQLSGREPARLSWAKEDTHIFDTATGHRTEAAIAVDI